MGKLPVRSSFGILGPAVLGGAGSGATRVRGPEVDRT